MSEEQTKRGKAWDVTRSVLYAANPLLGIVADAVSNAVTKTATVTEVGPIEQLHAEADRQEITMKMAEGQARVAQEVAIARRIETAEEVEIEEFYDYSGEGYAGLKTDGATLGLGVGASGKRVSRRVYRFKGSTQQRFEEISQAAMVYPDATEKASHT